MLFVVSERSWGYSFSVVRADDAEQAKRLACVGEEAEVIPLSEEGPPAVLWQEDESPDTPRERD